MYDMLKCGLLHDIPMQNLFRKTFKLAMIVMKNYEITGNFMLYFIIFSFLDQ